MSPDPTERAGSRGRGHHGRLRVQRLERGLLGDAENAAARLGPRPAGGIVAGVQGDPYISRAAGCRLLGRDERAGGGRPVRRDQPAARDRDAGRERAGGAAGAHRPRRDVYQHRHGDLGILPADGIGDRDGDQRGQHVPRGRRLNRS